PSNCSKVTSVVKVGKAPIEAIADNFAAINGKDGGKTSSLLGDDTLNGQPVVIGDVNLSVAGPLPTGLTLDTLTGEIIVAAGTAAGDYNVEYTICEKLNPSNCSIVTSKVVVIRAPIAQDDSSTGNTPGDDVTINLLDNDKLSDGSSITDPATQVTIDLDPSTPGIQNMIVVPNQGTWTVDPATGILTFSPEDGFTQTPTDVVYTLTEISTGLTDTATVKVEYTEVDIAVTEIDTPVVVDIFENDVDIPTEGTMTTTTPTNGTVEITDPNNTPNDPSDDVVTYVPNTDFTGTDTFDYTVCDNANLVNCQTATVTVTVGDVIADDPSSTEINTPVVVDIFENDSDIPTSGTISITTPANGTVTITDPNNTPNDPSDDVVTYVPNTDFTGTDTFDYTVCDNANPVNCQTATVTVTVGDVIADDPSSTEIDTPVVVDIFENDSDIPTSGTISITTPANGTVTITDPNNTPNDPSDDVVTYVPNTDFTGTDTFDYTVCDNASTPNCQTATVTVTVGDVIADDPSSTEIDTPVVVDIFENDSDIPTSGTISTTTPTNGTVEITDPNNTPNDPSDDVVTYVPNTDFTGTDTFDYTVCDNANPVNCQTATVTLTVGDVIADDPSSTEINTPVEVDVFENDSDIPTSGIISTTTPTNGTVTITDPNNTPNDPSDDVVTYVPNTDFTGTDTFDYTVCDNASTPNCQTATVTIVVAPKASPCGTPYNIMTPDNDGENDSFFISCIGNPEYSKNTVEIFNRWGNTVYKASGYNNESVSFKGISNGRTTLVVDEKLPAGTYYYIIDLGDGSKAKAGWLYINR
ncbi:Ig-like domain-containing protein, partial [Tenacibaculum finnmarkense]|uniref:Ig-like domain-containing protein n=1 Tax=Tenacibaculum finnmarkense TaxID=2781243 RepID=UPI00187B4677